MKSHIPVIIDGENSSFSYKTSKGFYTTNNSSCHRFDDHLSRRIASGETFACRTNGHHYIFNPKHAR